MSFCGRRTYQFFPVLSDILKRRIGWVRAVDGVDFEVKEGESSASSVRAAAASRPGETILGIYPPNAGRLFRGEADTAWTSTSCLGPEADPVRLPGCGRLHRSMVERGPVSRRAVERPRAAVALRDRRKDYEILKAVGWRSITRFGFPTSSAGSATADRARPHLDLESAASFLTSPLPVSTCRCRRRS